MAPPKENPLSTPLHGLYIPAGLLILGTAIMDWNYIPHAIGLAIVLGAFKVFRGSELSPRLPAPGRVADTLPESAKVLKPDLFQEFELSEKTVISHNVAMYAPPSPATPIRCTADTSQLQVQASPTHRHSRAPHRAAHLHLGRH